MKDNARTKEIKAELSNFQGSLDYFKTKEFPNVIFTPGIGHFLDSCKVTDLLEFAEDIRVHKESYIDYNFTTREDCTHFSITLHNGDEDDGRGKVIYATVGGSYKENIGIEGSFTLFIAPDLESVCNFLYLFSER